MATALGNHNHIAISQLSRAAGIDPKSLRVVVFDSSGQVVTNLLGGHVDVVASPAASVAAHAQAGKVRVLAISSKKRLPGPLADVPTWTEQGFRVVSGNVRNIVGPKGMSDEQVRYWDRVFAALTQQDEWRKEAERHMLENEHFTSSQTRHEMDELYKELREILGQLGLAK
jgi:tripartite-type tricarboxylate transporter receptor subunit TctC